MGFNIEPHKLWSLRLCAFYNGLWNGLWTSLTVSEKYRTNLQFFLKGRRARSVAMKYSGEPCPSSPRKQCERVQAKVTVITEN